MKSTLFLADNTTAMRNQDIYDRSAFCGIDNLYLTKEEDPFNRPCAGHDAAYERQLYPKERADQLFFERLEVYSWLEGNQREVKTKSWLYKAVVKLLGGVFY